MKITLCISLVFLLNLITLYKILAKPVDISERETVTISTNETESIDANLTTIADIETTTDINTIMTTILFTDITNENDTLVVTTISTIEANENETQSNITQETTTPTPSQSTSSNRVNLRVVVSPTTFQVQRGQTYELICIVYGGDENTNIYWIQEEPERRYALTDKSDKYTTASETTSRASITLDDPSKIGKYTCLAQNADGNSGSDVLTMQENNNYYPQPVYPVDTPPTYHNFEYLRIDTPSMANGDYVEIQCVGAAPEDEGKIQWYFNDRQLNDEDPVYPRGKTLHIRPISSPYLGNYRCSIPGGNYGDANAVLTFENKPNYDVRPSYDVQPVFNPPSPLSIDEGATQIIQSPTGYQYAYWTRNDGQRLPSNIYQINNDLQITNARSDHSGIYSCELYKADGTRIKLSYEIHVRRTQTYHTPNKGQRLIVQYTIRPQEPIQISWHKYTDQGYQPLSSAFTFEQDRLVLHRATPEEVGTYQLTVKNSHGEVREQLHINVESQYRHRTDEHRYNHHQQQQQQQQQQRQEQERVEVSVEPTEVNVGPGERVTVTCQVKGAQQYTVKWEKYSHDTKLPHYVYQQGNSVIIAPTSDTPSEQMYLVCQADVPNQTEPQRAYALVNIRGTKRKRQNSRR